MLLSALNDSNSVAEVIQTASLLRGTEVDLDELAPATAADLVELGWQSIRFRHPLVRSAIYHAAGWARRRKGHAALAQVLADDPDRRAWHRAEATMGADEEVASDLELAAVRAMRSGATADAVAIWERSARLSVPASRRTVRLFRAAELASDLGDAVLSSHLHDEIGIGDLTDRDRLRLEWLRGKTDGRVSGGRERVDELLDLAERADLDGDVELAIGFLLRAALRCWIADRTGELSDGVFLASDRVRQTGTDPRVLLIRAYSSPFKGAAEVIDTVTIPGSYAAQIHTASFCSVTPPLLWAPCTTDGRC